MIEKYLIYINHFLQTHAYFGLLFTFIVAFAESLPVLGTLIPGSITMTVIGILAGRGMIPISSMLFWASFGAFMGDAIGFWIGKHYNERLRYIWPFKKHPKWLSLSEIFFAKHGGKSIVIGRFIGPARSSVPLIAGLLKMQWSRFLIAAIPSAVLWAMLYMVPGILIGAISLELPHGMTTKFMLIGLAIIIFLWLIFWAAQRFFVFLAIRLNRLIDKLWNWLSGHHSSKFFIRAITVKNHPEDHHQLTLFILLLLNALIFLIILTNVITLGPLTKFNDSLFHFLQSIRTIHANQFFIIMTTLGDSIVMSVFSLVVIVGLIVKKQWRAAIHLLILLLVTIASIHFLKDLIYSPRPMGFAVPDPSSSFPSGHTLLSTTLLGFIAFLSATQLSKLWRWVPYTLAGILIFFVGFSRLYLGAHWLTDVLASLFLSGTFLLLTIVSYRRNPSALFAQKWHYLFLVLVLIIPWMSYVAAKYNTTLHRFVYIWPVQQTTFQDWWNHPHRCLPIYRVNRFGTPIQPLNVQWVDTLDNIKKSLTQRGWTTLEEKNMVKAALGHLTGYRPEQNLPLFQPLYRQQPPVLLMIKYLPNQLTIIELRLWESGVEFTDKELPLWIGTINYHNQQRHLITLKRPSAITLTDSGGINHLSSNLSRRQFKIIHITKQQPKKVRSLDWDGSIIIIGP